MKELQNKEQPFHQVYKVLADPTRFAIFDILMTGTHCHCEIAEKLGLSLSLVSHHLRVLIEIGLVNATRDKFDARWIHYSINQEKLLLFREQLLQLTSPDRIKERASVCAPEERFVFAQASSTT